MYVLVSILRSVRLAMALTRGKTQRCCRLVFLTRPVCNKNQQASFKRPKRPAATPEIATMLPEWSSANDTPTRIGGASQKALNSRRRLRFPSVHLGQSHRSALDHSGPAIKLNSALV
jgi:hypothetical protein